MGIWGSSVAEVSGCFARLDFHKGVGGDKNTLM
jgi:hypothetical protein